MSDDVEDELVENVCPIPWLRWVSVLTTAKLLCRPRLSLTDQAEPGHVVWCCEGLFTSLLDAIANHSRNPGWETFE